MINEAHISLSGYVATQPLTGQTRTGIPSVSMRVAWTPRRLDRVTGEWADAGTSFLTVLCYRKLAENVGTCLRKGDPVIVRGRVTTRDYEDKNGAQRTVIEVDALSVGHDLNRGVATFQRVRPQTGMTAVEYRNAEEAALGGSASSDYALADSALADSALAEAALSGGERGGPGRGAFAAGGPADETAFASLAAGSAPEMFDEDAVGVLAEEAASAGVPF